jgi:hypothetical protein
LRHGFGFRFWFFTGPEQNGRNSEILVLFGRTNLNFRTKFDQISIFLKKSAKFPKFDRIRLVNHLPAPTEMGEIRMEFDFSGQNSNFFLGYAVHGRWILTLLSLSYSCR